VFLLSVPEVVITEELKLDLIRVDCRPDSLFKYELIYKAGNATGIVGVYSFDEDWYYLYKEDTERYRVKRRKELEGIAPAFTYKQRRDRQADKQDNRSEHLNTADVVPHKVAEKLSIRSQLRRAAKGTKSDISSSTKKSGLEH
jgi:stage V sporulation protein G